MLCFWELFKKIFGTEQKPLDTAGQYIHIYIYIYCFKLINWVNQLFQVVELQRIVPKSYSFLQKKKIKKIYNKDDWLKHETVFLIE